MAIKQSRQEINTKGPIFYMHKTNIVLTTIFKSCEKEQLLAIRNRPRTGYKL